MKHPINIKKYNGSIQNLAIDISNLRYDALRDFLTSLSWKIETDSYSNESCGKTQLAEELEELSGRLGEAADKAEDVWKICEKYVK